jgi:hypothetical protein
MEMIMNRAWMVVAAVVVACTSEPADDAGESSSGAQGSSEGSASSSGADASTETGESSGESGGQPIDVGCEDPEPVLQSDGLTPSGFVQCSDGFRHRAELVDCIVPDTGNCDECGAECGDDPLERCVSDLGLGTCSCVTSCVTNADCGEGQACACTGAIEDVPRCVPAACDTTADCGEGLCGISGSNDCGFDASLACLDASSECRLTVCEGDVECACYASGGEYVCHDECFSGCG